MSTSWVFAGGGPVAGAVAGVVVPTQDPAPPPGQGPEFGKASPIALVVILLLALATVFLIRSMTKRIRRLPASFDEPQAQGPEAQAQGRDEDRQVESPKGDDGSAESHEQVDRSKGRSG